MNIIEEIRTFRKIVLGKQDKLIPGDHIILDDDVISVDFAPVDALLDRLEEVEDDINTLNFDVTELDIRLDAAEENIEDAQDHLDSVDYSINILSESLDVLETKVDNIHGFEIIALSEGQYDPETMKPTIENPKTNTLYLVPNADPYQSNLWIEWLWISDRWEQFGTAAIDLSEYVKKTDTPTAILPGVVKVNRLNGVQLLSNGQLAITPANLGDIQSGQNEYLPITPAQQHNAVFYGLARASRTPSLYYNAVDKTNIRLMIDAGSHAQVENLANDVEEFGVKVEQLLNRTGETRPGMVWESKIDGAGWSEAAKGRVVDVTKDGTSLMDEYGIVELPDVDVPTKTSDLINDSGFITSSALPTKVSDLQNDAGFLTEIPLATFDSYGAMKPAVISFYMPSNGYLYIKPVQENDINYRTGSSASYKALTLDRIDYAVKEALTDGKGPAYTSEEQAAARTRLGIAAEENEIFEATYGVTTYDEIAEAVEDGKMVVMTYGNYIYTLSVLSSKTATFNSLDSGMMRWAYIQSGETSVWHNGTDMLQQANLSQTIEGQETSTTKYPTTKAVVDYIGNAGFMPESQLMGAGIKSISWTTNVEGTYTTVEDPLKAQRPSGTNTRYWVEMSSCPYFYHSKMYRVTFNGTVYDNLECRYGVLVDENKGSVIGSDTTVGGCWQMIGNRALYDSRYIDTGEPFAILYVEHSGMHDGGAYYYSSTVGHGILLTASAETVTLKIETATITKTDLPHCLDEDFGGGDKLLETTNSTYPRSSWGQGNVVGRGSFAIGNSNISTGQFALAEGTRNVASGYCSHVEGRNNISSGERSHSEGKGTIASGVNAHAEGEYTIASGNDSHAEGGYLGSYTPDSGQEVVASGNVSHAEGASTHASGLASHSEGYLTIASANYSHSEGNHTIAASSAQHAQGKYNIEDVSNKYAHIVGNGSKTARSNAHTLDWNGLGWFKGGLKVGGTGQDDSNAENVVLESDLSSYALESDLEALEDKVDALHDFEIVFLTTGEYDPTTGIPTILGPQEGTLYLVPSGQASPDVWTEWLWTGEAWEKFGSSSIDLSNYVQKTDYANTTYPGVVKMSNSYQTETDEIGNIRAKTLTYAQYSELRHTYAFISNGTLNNVLTGRGYPVDVMVNGTSVVDGNKVANIPIPSISYDETEEMLVWQTTANDGNEVSY